MALDHYISQVYLKNFNAPALGGHLMYAIRKSDLKPFTPNSKAVCRIEEGNSNAYLLEDRAVEEFLREIEPKYNKAIEKLASKDVDPEVVFVLAGFVAYVITCSPAGMRIHSELFKSSVEATARMIERRGGFPPPPPELGGQSLFELMESGKVCVTIDPKYPQAMGIVNILSSISAFGNFKWEVLINNSDSSPFFTSDYPVAIEQSDDPRIYNRLVPLSPKLAIRIYPDTSVDRSENDYSFSNFRVKYKKLNNDQVRAINQILVRCAETTVFYRDHFDWVPRFVERNSMYRIEPQSVKMPTDDGTFLLVTQKISRIDE